MSQSNDRLASRLNFLKQVVLFEKLTDKQLQKIADNLQPKNYKSGQLILYQTESGRSLFIIYSGKVRIFSDRFDVNGKELVINLYGPHEIIGEFSVIDSKNRAATIRAIEDSILLEIDADIFQHYMYEMPQIAMGMCKLLVDKLRWATTYAEVLAKCDVRERLLYILLSYNQRFGNEIIPKQQYVLALSLTQADLATLVGASREWVSKIMSEWANQKLITYNTSQITIHDLPKLQEMLNSITKIHFKKQW